MKTDSQLQQDVGAELKCEPSVQATHIGVELKDGVVTLAVRLDSYFEKWNADQFGLGHARCSRSSRPDDVGVLSALLSLRIPQPRRTTC
jgi:hypothetical protein